MNRLSALLIAWLLGVPALAAVSKPHTGITLVRTGNASLAVVDLCASGVSVRATKYAERKATAEQWATRGDVNAQVAVNADFFDNGVWSWVIGRARGAGEDWPAGTTLREIRQYWQFGPRFAELQGNASVGPAAGVTEIVGSHNVLISEGRSLGPNFDGDGVLQSGARRTAVGLSKDKATLFLFTTNDALTGTGMVNQMVGLASEAGAPPIWVATNMDGGGSTQMYVAGLGSVISSTRQVNNHLGVRATGSGRPTHCPAFPWEAQWVGAGFAQGTTMTLVPGQQEPGWVEVKNVGTQTWTPEKTHLGLTEPRDGKSPLRASDWLSDDRLAGLTAPVPPGAIGRFTFSLKAPATPGTYVQHFNLVQEGVAWFSDSGGPADNNFWVKVISEIPKFRAELVEDWPGGRQLSLVTGATREGQLVLKNTGTQTWEPGKTFLATTGPRDVASPLAGPDWVKPDRAATVKQAVAPGERGTFAFTVQAPAQPGVYKQTFGLVQEQVAWFASSGGPADDALWLEATVSLPPVVVPSPPDAGSGSPGGGGGSGKPEEPAAGGCGATGGALALSALLALLPTVRRRRR